MEKILFIGAGSIAEALIHGWLKKEVVTNENLYVTNRSNKERLIEIQEAYGINILENSEWILQMDLIILAMKPKDAKVALEQLRPYIRQDTAILSVLAGISISTIEMALGARPIARAMPNTSATIGLSASGISFNDHVSAEQKQL